MAADYYRAMDQIERQLTLTDVPAQLTTPGQLLTLVDALQEGTLNEKQRKVI